MNTRTRTPDLREQVYRLKYDHIRDAAVKATERRGFHDVTRTDIALEAKVSPPLVSRYLGDMNEIKNLVMTLAVERGILTLVAQGLTAQHPTALEAPAELRAQAVSSLA